MAKAPKKRDPAQNPLQGDKWTLPSTPQLKPTPSQERPQVDTSTRFSTCTRCMGFGGMDGGCPKCGGTGFTD